MLLHTRGLGAGPLAPCSRACLVPCSRVRGRIVPACSQLRPVGARLSRGRPLLHALRARSAAGAAADPWPCRLALARPAQMFALLIHTQKLSFLGGNGVDGGQGSADYIYGTLPSGRGRCRARRHTATLVLTTVLCSRCRRCRQERALRRQVGHVRRVGEILVSVRACARATSACNERVAHEKSGASQHGASQHGASQHGHATAAWRAAERAHSQLA